MSTSDQRQNISEAVLRHLQELLKVKDQDPSVANPEEMYVELRDRPSYVIPPGTVLGKWMVTRQKIAALQNSVPRPVHLAVGKNCYQTAWGEFAISENAATVTIGFKLSPKFGRGDIYETVTDEGGKLSLRRMKPAWSL